MPTVPSTTSLFDSDYVKGSAYAADAYARLVLDKDFSKAYDLALKAIAAFGAHHLVMKAASDLQTLRAKGELPEPAAIGSGETHSNA